MKLHASVPGAANVINAYGEDYVMVNGARYAASVIVTATEVRDWDASSFEKLAPEDFDALKNLGAEIVLLGTGPKQRFPHPRLTAALARAGIGVEVMDMQAACRTFNILVAEERKVAAALLFE
ncbi:MAG: Mth938-like domain-containing protein [Betaproteobacteria bacterium]